MITQRTSSLHQTLSRNVSSAEIFGQSKPDYEEALEIFGYKVTLQYMQPDLQQNNTKRTTCKII